MTDFSTTIKGLDSLVKLDYGKIVEFGEEFGGNQFRDEDMNQLRKFLDFLKKQEYHFKHQKGDFNHQELLVLKIYLKNSENHAKPNFKKAWQDVAKVMDAALSKIGDGEEGFKDLGSLLKMWEAIIAYHPKK